LLKDSIGTMPEERDNKATEESITARRELDRQSHRELRANNREISEQDKGVLDEFRRYAQRRAGEREEALITINGRAKEPRRSLYAEFRENRESLYSKAREVVQGRGRARANRKRDIKGVKQIVAQVTKLGEAVKRVGEREQYGKVEQEVERVRNDLEREVSRTYNVFEQGIRKVEQEVERIIEEREPDGWSHGMGM